MDDCSVLITALILAATSSFAELYNVTMPNKRNILSHLGIKSFVHILFTIPDITTITATLLNYCCKRNSADVISMLNNYQHDSIKREPF